MSASGAGGPRVQRLFERAASADSLGGVIFQGIGAILLAIGTGIASGVLTIADLVIVPAQALIQAGADLIDAVFGGAATIIDFGAIGTAISIGPDGLFNLGPLSFALGIGAALLGLYLIIQFAQQRVTGDSFLAGGLGPDLPFFGVTEEGEEEE